MELVLYRGCSRRWGDFLLDLLQQLSGLRLAVLDLAAGELSLAEEAALAACTVTQCTVVRLRDPARRLQRAPRGCAAVQYRRWF